VRAIGRATLVAAVALALAACGGNDDSEATASCKAEAENAASAAVVAKAYERGELGTRAQVQAAFADGDRIFDAQGRMIPYRDLQGLTRAHFDDYMASDEIPGEVQHDMADAREAVREDGYPGC
jgi:hypothetical protein